MERLLGRGGEKYARLAQEMLEVLVLLPGSGLEERHRSGVLCLMNRRTGRWISNWVIGEIEDEDRLNECRDLAEKKCRDLFLRATDSPLSSWQFRDPDLGRWGGGVVGKHIISFSGLPELANEALVLTVSVFTGNMSLKRAESIARLSDNRLFFRILNLLKND